MYNIGFDISALDASFKAHSQRGIGRYVRELNSFYGSIAPRDIRVKNFDHRSLVASSKLGKLFDLSPIGKITLKQQFVYPLQMRSASVKDYSLFHFPAHMDGPSWCPAPYMLTVLDLIPLVQSDLYKADKPNWRFAFARWLEIKSIQNASFIVAISEATARDLEEVLGIDPTKIIVTPLGVDEKFFDAKLIDSEIELRNRYDIPPDRKILLYVGGIDQRKNWKSLLDVLQRIKASCLEASQEVPVLVMSGGIFKDRQFPKLKERIKELGLQEDVVLPGFVPDDDLLQLYKITAVFCFLSLYEGFGLPVLEAMAAGVPVVCSNTSSLPEVAGTACKLVDPENVVEISNSILEVLNSENYALQLKEQGVAQAKKFPWSQTGEKTLAAYEQCLRSLGK